MGVCCSPGALMLLHQSVQLTTGKRVDNEDVSNMYRDEAG